ncbi:MAG: cell envelope integrity protein CreD [Gammaproteobacteria bacterium]
MLESIKNTLSSRIIIISLIALAMTIPLNMVAGVIQERNFYYDSVIRDISALWGGSQTLIGPVLIVPFIEKHETEEALKSGFGPTETKRKTQYLHKHAVFLPKELRVASLLDEQYRHRGIYKSLVYSADLKLQAQFEDIDINSLSNKIDEVLFDEAELLVGLSDTKAIDKIHRIKFDDQLLNVVAGVGKSGIISSGFSARLDKPLTADESYEFELNFAVKGSRSFRLAPVGENTWLEMQSSWPHPKFAGQLLPNSHDIHADGFTAHWEIPHLARNYPQAWVREHRGVDIQELVTGVDLFEPVFVYSKITRAVKYGLLFIALTFITFFLFEISTASSLHYVQYGLVGIALSLFYLLLLSLSEHIAFAKAYFSSSALCISMISGYAGYALQSKSRAVLLSCLLATLFGLIYTLLRQEDFALLTGTLLLTAALAALMFVTKDLNRLHAG